MEERKQIPKSIRFEIFKRDSFTCQYCGRTAPNVILECDHIVPVAEGGTNDEINLITSCRDCNRGKGKRMLTDSQVIDRQKAHLNELNEMREQTEMMIQWRKELMELENKQTDEIVSLIQSECGVSNLKLSEVGVYEIRKLLRRFGFVEVYTSTRIAIETYYDNQCKIESIAFALSKIGGICYNRKKEREEYESSSQQ